MDLTMAAPLWGRHFSIDDGRHDGVIRLAQLSADHFTLESTVTYNGATGLEHREPPLSDESWALLRTVTPEDLQETDLASIPAPMRWWINTYGRHTAAALIHDRFIGLPDGLPEPLTRDGLGEEHIDRYFRFMLGDAGIGFIERWVMWSAVALRTRWKNGWVRKAQLVVWAAVALVGLACFVRSAVVGDLPWMAASAVAPLPASALLWRKQWGAGVVASYVVFPFILVPVAVALALVQPLYLLQVGLGQRIESIARLVWKEAIEPSYYDVDPNNAAPN